MQLLFCIHIYNYYYYYIFNYLYIYIYVCIYCISISIYIYICRCVFVCVCLCVCPYVYTVYTVYIYKGNMFTDIKQTQTETKSNYHYWPSRAWWAILESGCIFHDVMNSAWKFCEIIPTSVTYIYTYNIIYIYIVILSYFSFCPPQLGWSSHRSAKGVLSPSIFLECFSLLPCTFIVLSISLSLGKVLKWFCMILLYWTKLSSD